MATVKQVQFLATSAGFYNSSRVRKNKTFVAPEDEKFDWAVKADTVDVTASTGGSAQLLEGNTKDIVDSLAGLSDQELNSTLAAEQAGQSRKGVLAAIEDERANRIGRVSKQKNPAGKNPDEKDPLSDPLA